MQTATEKTNDRPVYKNAAAAVDDRVADLLKRMTLEEKVAQMVCIWNQKKDLILDEAGQLDYAKLKKNLKDGIGQVGRISDTRGGLTPAEMAQFSNDLQKYFVEETRLGIPAIFHEECLHGLAGRDATSYPQPIGLASTFNPDLAEKIYTTVAEDARTRGAHQALTPVLDVAREPRWGRVEETFGEDPHLIGRMATAAVRGFQGDGTFKDGKHVIATLKHFAAHGMPEGGNNCAPVNVSERELRDTFLAPFREVLKKANAMSVMASYNEIDGRPSHANTWLLRDVLRGEWGFKGYVVSDYFAVTELFDHPNTESHRVAGSKSEAAALAVKAGVNIELPDPDCYPEIIPLVQSGKLDIALVDELVAAMLKYKFLLGLFDHPYVPVDAAAFSKKLEADRPLALQAAHETMVLLKNDKNLLPLAPKAGSTVAVIGPNADRVMIGGYSGTPKYTSTLLQGIKDKVGKDVHVVFSEGCKITVGGAWNEDVVTPSNPEDDRVAIAQAVEVAKKADVVVLAIGGNEQTSREAWALNHLGDRPNLELFGSQLDLVKAILATGKPVVAVLSNGRPKALTFINDHVPAILECWYLGQESGRAIADVLFGAVNPSGKLPMSFPRSAGHLPCYYNHKPSARRGYLFDDVTPLFPFGFGLSYTTFAFSNVRLEKTSIGLASSTKMLVDVKNTGSREGSEVVQMYIRDEVSSVTRPVRELKGFKKIHLRPGETATVALEIGTEQLAFTNVAKDWVVEPGEFTIMVGNSSRVQDLQSVTLTVTA